MEFDEIKKIWDSQNKEYMYAINEQALHNRILTKKNKATRTTDVSELLLMITNVGAGFLILPSTAAWWLDHYTEFKQHLERLYLPLVREENTCVIFDLRSGQARLVNGKVCE